MPKPLRQLIVLGDSGVYGWGDPSEGGWCERLRRCWMAAPGAPVIYSLGIRGDGLESVAARWRHEWSARGELRRQLPAGLILAVGLNDSARVGRPDGGQKLGADAFGFGLERLLREMTAQAWVMVLGLTAVNEQAMPFADCLWYGNDDVAIHENRIEEVCMELDLPFLGLHRLMRKQPAWLTMLEPDGIHLNGSGHAWIHERLRNWSPLLNWAGLEKQVTPPILYSHKSDSRFSSSPPPLHIADNP